jgi:hypothetical protein
MVSPDVCATRAISQPGQPNLDVLISMSVWAILVAKVHSARILLEVTDVFVHLVWLETPMLAAREKLQVNAQNRVLVPKEKFVPKENVFAKEDTKEKVQGFAEILMNVS